MTALAVPPGVRLPTHLDLPDSDGKPVENHSELPRAIFLTDGAEPVLEVLSINDPAHFTATEDQP